MSSRITINLIDDDVNLSYKWSIISWSVTIVDTSVSETVSPNNWTVIRQTANNIITTLPASPSTGDNFHIIHRWWWIDNTIDWNWNNIDGQLTQPISNWDSYDIVFDWTQYTVI